MNIAIIAGSNRKYSTSTQLTQYLKTLIEQKGHEVKLHDLYQSPLPFYSPDESYSDHEGLKQYKATLIWADAIVLATPEYHGSVSGVLKNALDFVGQDHFRGKPVLSVSSSGGAVGVSSLTQMQAMVRNMHGINCPEWISIGGDQRKSFEPGKDSYEINQGMEDRIHRVLTSFLGLTKLVRGKAE